MFYTVMTMMDRVVDAMNLNVDLSDMTPLA